MLHARMMLDMVTMRDIRAAASQIAAQFQPQRIILFGSYAYGTPSTDSDVDLLVLIKGTRVHDRALGIREAIDFKFPVDLLVRSPDEFNRRLRWGDQFLREIQRKGKVLYEAADARVGEKSRGRLRDRPARGASAQVAEPRQRRLPRAAVR